MFTARLLGLKKGASDCIVCSHSHLAVAQKTVPKWNLGKCKTRGLPLQSNFEPQPLEDS